MRKRFNATALVTAAVGVGAIAGMWFLLAYQPWPIAPREEMDEPSADVEAEIARQQQGGLAMKYAKAVQDGDCKTVIDITLWISERLRHEQLANPDGVNEVRRALCVAMRERPVEGNQIRPEGIEDQYVFAPGAEFQVVSVDEGRQDLERPAKERVWIEVSYPLRERAPIYEDRGPIKSMTVGINISADAYILKAGIIGNLEIPEGLIALN